MGERVEGRDGGKRPAGAPVGAGFVIEFSGGTRDFQACDDAQHWLHVRGFSVGIMQGPSPRGILLGDYLIAKWRNLSRDDIAALDGKMSGNMRHGPVRIEIFSGRPDALVAVARAEA